MKKSGKVYGYWDTVQKNVNYPMEIRMVEKLMTPTKAILAMVAPT